ncbi:chromodomain-helicase-DNA-binding protein 7 isoform X2 [Diorhabda carinulata]|uniref:chromodomain-helicase-DNA-binding protein 7 isoform X2 n=1 Tax=Diorhabda carinulata TaxID=1163345 RepID=UPI0025A012F9|nr:chromodomain-helicase-DNA-binding protein 7 isoform X2 [Diorhabda carinulata]XP_057666139.1 chromodomain-helicase-DNA-binding protein 7 isoform X2 [Diorhabda carinulata]
MDSYDLFGEDGTGMLEGLPELGGGTGGGGAGGSGFDPAPVTGAPRNATNPYPTAQQQQPIYSQETPLQKLATFGGPDFNHMDPNAQSMYAQGYGTDRPMGPPPGAAYQHQRQMAVRPPSGASSAQYPYQTDNMYSMPDVQVGAMGDTSNMQAAAAAGWSHNAAAAAAGYPSMHRYSQMSQYRQQSMTGYPHQQEPKQQFPTGGQHPMMQQPHQTSYQMQQRHTPHYPQAASGYPTSAASQSYAGYMHQRLPHHHQYPQPHHQMDMTSVSQTQQYAQMSHNQSLSHATPTAGHMGQTPHSVGHSPAQTHPSPQQSQPSNPMAHPPNIGYNQSHQSMQSMQRAMEVPPSQQQFQSKHSAGPMGNVSPQYRAPFPQLSPQMSPRSQMSPRPTPTSQMSPRPSMSPAKPNMSPHPTPMQQTTLSPRPAANIAPKVSAPSPAPIPAYSQQSTLQALEQMVMPPSSTNSSEYPTYQSRASLGPPQSSQNPLSPAMGMRNPLSEQQWPPVQSRQVTHLSSLNGSLNMMDQNPVPTSQSIPPSQSLPPSSLPNTQMPPAPNINVSFGNDEIRSDINNSNSTNLMEMTIREKESSVSQSIPVSSQNEFTSVQSPTTSIPDKMPSSTTNTEVNVPTSVPSVPSHPPTPTPTSTTDDNITNTQDTSLPSNSESVKQIDESSNTSSTSQQQTPSQSSQNNFTDFNCVSSMTGYPSQPGTPKSNKMDDLVQSNASIFSQDNSVSQESLPESNKSDHSSIHSPRLQSPISNSQSSMPLPSSAVCNQRDSRTPMYSVNYNVSTPSPTQSHSSIQTTNKESSTTMPSVHSNQMITSQVLPKISQHLSSIQNQNQQQSPSNNTQNQVNITEQSVSSNNNSLSSPPPVSGSIQNNQNNLPSIFTSNSMIRTDSPIPAQNGSLQNVGQQIPPETENNIAVNTPSSAPSQNPSNTPVMLSQSIPNIGNQPNIPISNQNPPISVQSNPISISIPGNLPTAPGQNTMQLQNNTNQLSNQNMSAPTSVANQNTVQCIQSPSPVQSNMPMMVGSQRIQTPPSTPMSQHPQIPHQMANANIPQHANVANIPSNNKPGMFDQTNQMMNPNGVPIGAANRGIPPRITPHGMPMSHSGMPMGMTGMMSSMGGMMPGQDIPGYQTPISHHQERAALQQQLQEMYCMPPGPEHQEKITFLQERLNLLSQHEASDQCNGGSQCILQSPMFNSQMIDSPQVSSTTGRGRGKGPPKPRKPRVKKGEKLLEQNQVVVPPVNTVMPIITQSPQQLPVSEDFVTPGAGLSIPSNEMSEFTDFGTEIEPEKKKKGRKPRSSNKPKDMKDPKEPKPPKSPKEPKIPKERKKRESKDPKEPRLKRKYVRKKKTGDSEESATDESFNKSSESIEEISPSKTSEAEAEAAVPFESKSDDPDSQTLPESSVPSDTTTIEKPEEMQADSQTPAEGSTSIENDDKKDEYNFDDEPSPELVELPKRSKKAKSQQPRTKSVVSKRSKRGTGTGRKRRGTIVPESDGENEDMISTPPPSPPDDGESSSKRRSARNTQRKKYIDDVMLRFSDDDAPPTPTRSRKPPVPATPPIVTAPPPPVETPPPPLVAEDGNSNTDAKNQMNYVYVNPTEEDSMVVQYVLSARMTRRKKKKESPIDESKKEVKVGNTDEEKKEFSDDEEDQQTASLENHKPETKVSNDDNDDDEMEDVEEYFVKYRNFSYLHCEWKTEDELYKGDRRIANKIKRFRQKQAQQMNIFENLEEEPFNPDYVEVDRVLDLSEHTDSTTGEVVKHYLVKWRALQYEDCTWELEEDVDPIKIQQYERFNKIPPKDTWKVKKRPTPDQWTKLEKSPIYKGGNSLREYQLEGLNWLLFSWFNGRNCILADEMGLGKTIQSLTFLHAVGDWGVRGPFLVIAPLSTIPNWQREIESWTDMNVIVYHGSATSRNMLQEYEMYHKNEKGQFIKEITKFNILITTFEIIVTDFADLKGFNWRICVIDEAHRLKNRNCKLLEGLRQLTLEHRVLLSGTPLQNNVNELFSLLNFLEPTQFSNNETFISEFGQLKTEQEVQKLQILLKPMMLRRLKEDVEKSLAPKEETVVEVELTNIQKKYYRGILERNFSFLSKGTTHANIPNLMNTMMELRKCCIHPYLLNGAEEQIQYDYKNQCGEDSDAYYKALIQSSGKMVLIDKLLPKLKANGHRVLIFSQMVKCLDILEDYLMYKKYPFERIDGRIRGNLRQAAIDRFSRPDSDRFVFLLCTKAGGLGINLTAADTVIIYDSDWNPQNDLQAQARCHRIGQQKMVKIYRLLCRNTYEREMFDKASLKLGLDKAILQSMNTSQGGKDAGNRQLSKKEIEDLLKKGAYGALLDEDDGDKFCEEDIDVILARRTQVITMESEKGSTFSKASFASSANRSDIAIDDPDFWNKWAKKAEIDTTEKDENEDLVISEPRRRTQIKRYGHDESAIDMSELESSSDSDPENEGLGGLRTKKKLRKRKYRPDDYIPREGEPRGDIVYGSWARRECFMVERGLLTFGWGRWTEILVHSQLRKGWKETDIEDCARVILLYCLRFYRGDEKIRSFIWDLIAPSENGEQKISKNHHGLKDPVPRGIRNKHKKKDKGILTKDLRHPAITDPNHWSKHEKYDGDIFLESNYKKHLGRHANKVLLRVRMLYYIKHEIIGDLVQHIADGVHASALPIYPPVTEQLPCVWWDAECDKSLLIGTWKHGYENYTEMRADPTLCFLSRCGPPSDRDLQMATNNAQPPTPALNEDDVEDDDTNEESSVKFKNRDPSEANSEIAEPSPGPSASSETQPLDSEDRGVEEGDDKNWPTITDLNTRLRRVITSYQRNCRKEEQKLAASKAKTPQIDTALSSPLAALAQVSQQFDPRDAAALGLQGWDLQQLALYLLMERQGKQSLEALRDPVKEKEKLTIGKRWSKREEADFFRVASSYGVIYYRKKKSYDWIKFKQLAKLEKKSEEELTEYYKHFVMMCKKQTGMNIEESNYDNTIEHISEEKARRTLERLELLSRIREEILTHPKLDERLRVCLTSADMPEWWIAGKHDRDLLLGVAKHGLGRTDYYLLNDPDLSFHAVLRKKVRTDTTDTKDAIKLESHEDILKFDKDEILVKLEKGEGTLKIEKVAHKKEPAEKKMEEDNKVNLTIVKSEVIEKETLKEEEDKEEEEETKCEVKEELKEPEVKAEEANAEIEDTEKKVEAETVSEKAEKEPESEDLSKAKEEKKDNNEELKKLAEAEADLCSKQAAELKAMFPDLEVIQPLSRLSQVDTFVLRDKPAAGALDFSETTVAQLFNNAVKWPKEYAIQVRLQHIIYAVETKEWPVTKSFSAYATGIGNEFDIPIHEIPSEPVKRETSTPLSIGETEIISVNAADRFGVNKKRKRHIAIDVETERAKLHALLNSSHVTNPLPSKHQLTWENEDSEESRRSTPVPQSNLQPPPAHQQTSRMNLSTLKMPYDLQYHPPVAKTIGQTTVIPGTSSTLTPIDLSSSIPKPPEKTSNVDLQSEVQDFSVKKSSTPISTSKTGNKLDDTLSKLMKRKNCPEPEPLVGKEKKRKKLDEIVLGLSAAKEQSLFTPESSKKQQVTPSVTVTPTSAPVSTSHNPNQKPFTITVTSVPSTAPSSRSSSLSQNILPSLPTGGKDSFSTFLAQAEQQNMLLKKQQQQQQQQQRKSYEAMIADIAGKDSFSSFLAQAEEQNMLLKKQQEQHQQQQRKSYEAMIADIGKVSDFSSKVNSYSHEAKVNKWLAEQNAALAEQPLSADYLAARRRRPRVDPTLLDWKKLTGDENVSVIHRVTGKKLTGPKAPTLKRLGQWLMENPMYDIDPKWSELVKERGNLSHDLQKRLPGQPSGSSSTSSSKSKGNVPGRPPLLSSPTGSTSSVSSANLTTSLPSSMSFPSLGTSTLAGLNSNLLTGLSGLGQFDPKTNPLLMPFAGLPNMNALGSMGGLSNLTNMNLFANLAGLGLPGLGSMDPSALAGAATDTSKNISKSSTSTSKSSKPQEAHSSSKSQSSSSLPTTNPFPFFFPNPSLLYTPLGLGGLNPFTLQPGMSAAYDTLAQQCGLLNGNLNPAASPNSSSKMNKLPTSRPPSATTTTSSGSSGQGRPRSSSRDVHLQQLLLPPDTQILESISKAANLDITLKQGKSDKKEDKRKALENLRGMLPTDFSSSMKEKKTALPNLSDFTKLLEAQVSQNSKKSQEQQMKEALEHFSRTNIELVAKAMSEEQNKYMATASSVSHKRPRVSSESSDRAHSIETEVEHPPVKRIRDASDKSRTPTPLPTPPTPTSTPTPSSTPSVTPTMAIPTPVVPPPVSIPSTMSNDQEGVDIEALLPPSTVVKASASPQKTEKPDKSPDSGRSVTPQEPELSGSKVSPLESPDIPSKEDEQSKAETSEESETPPKKNAKRTRGKRKSGEVPIDHESVIAKKNLRSSASRSAAAAAARQKMEAENAQRESENNS